MFISPLIAAQRRLTPAQKKALVIIAYQLSVADGTVAPEEDLGIDGIEDEMGLNLDLDLAPQDLYVRPDPAVFDSRRARVAVVLELLCLAYADKHFHPDESVMLRELVDAFGIDDALYRTLKDWARRQIALTDEIQPLFAEEA